MKPLLSVVIATKNREKYCIAAIDSILNFKDNRIEIAVSDNSNTTLVKNYVEVLESSQIKYFYDGSEISSIENFNRAMELASGEYVILIGDDDAILPRLIEIAEWAHKNHVDSICSINSNSNITYFWPNAVKKYKNGFAEFSYGSSRITKINIRNQLNKLIKNGMQLYMFFNLPKTYHGLVKKELMDELKFKTGHYYGGLSPDIYSCVALACLAKEHYTIDEPLSIAGVCATSTTAGHMKGAHSGELGDIPHLKNRGIYVWSDKIPQFYSINTIWAESGIKALEDIGEYKLVSRFNIYNLLVHSTVNNYKFIPEVLRREKLIVRKRNDLSFLKYNFHMTIAYFNFFSNKLKRIYQKKANKRRIIFKNVESIQKVIDLYQKNMH